MSNQDPVAQTMMYDANKKSLGVTYLLWFFLGGLGGHRFYMGKIGSAITIPIFIVLGIVLSVVGIGPIFMAIVVIWLIVDAFLIPGWVRKNNTLLAMSLSSSGRLPS